MKLLLTYSTLAALSLTLAAPLASARDRDRDRDDHRDHRNRRDHHDRGDHYDRRGSSRPDRSRTIYVIERDRPVQRVVFVDPSGRYYRISNGRRVFVQGRSWESYPTREYTRDGRRRTGLFFFRR